MSLTYSQKSTIRQLFKTHSVEEIAEKINSTPKKVQQHMEENPQFFTHVKEKTTSSFIFTKQWFISQLPSLAVIIFITLITFANGFFADFVSDDTEIPEKGSYWGSLDYLFSPPWYLYPLRKVLFFISYHLGGMPFTFRMWNILFHIGVICLVYFIVPFFSKKKYLPFIVASLAAVHPMMVESVTWISGGSYAQAAFFVLLAFFLYLQSRERPHVYLYIGSIVSFIIALTYSEKIVAFPVMLFTYEFFLRKDRIDWLRTAPFFFFSFIKGLQVLTQVDDRMKYLNISDGNPGEFAFHNPFMQIPVAIASYLKLFVWPRHLTLYHSEFHLNYVQFGILFAIFVLFLFALIYTFFKKRVLFFWLLFFIVCQLVTLSSFGLGWIVAERYVYLASIGIYFVVGYLLHALIENKKYTTLGWTIFSILFIALIIRTIVRNIDWQNQDKLWIATGKASPSDPKTHNNLGDMYARHGNLPKAAEEFAIAIRLNPRYADGYHNLANIQRMMGNKEEAYKLYRTAIEINPNIWQSHQNLAAIHYEKQEYTEAIHYMENAIAIFPTNPQLYVSAGVIYFNAGEKEKAVEAFQKVLQFDPQNQTALQGLRELGATP